MYLLPRIQMWVARKLPAAATDFLQTCFNWPQLTAYMCTFSEHRVFWTIFVLPDFVLVLILYNFEFNLLKRKLVSAKYPQKPTFQSNFSFNRLPSPSFNRSLQHCVGVQCRCIFTKISPQIDTARPNFQGLQIQPESRFFQISKQNMSQIIMGRCWHQASRENMQQPWQVLVRHKSYPIDIQLLWLEQYSISNLRSGRWYFRVQILGRTR